MKPINIKNIFSLLLAATALTRSNLVNAMVTSHNKTAETTGIKVQTKTAPTISDKPVATAALTQTKKKPQTTSAVAVRKPVQQLTSLKTLGITTFNTISSRTRLPITLNPQGLIAPIAVRNSSLEVIIYLINPETNKYSLFDKISCGPTSFIPVPFEKLDCTKEYKCLVSISRDSKSYYSGIVYNSSSEDKKRLPAATGKKLLTAPAAKDESTALTAKHTSKALISSSPTTQREFVSSFTLTQSYILEQQNALKEKNIEDCLKAYKMWHDGTIGVNLTNYYDKVDHALPKYTENQDTFKKIKLIVEFISYIKSEDVCELQEDITAAIDESSDLDEKDKANLKRMLAIMVRKKTSATTIPVAK